MSEAHAYGTIEEGVAETAPPASVSDSAPATKSSEHNHVARALVLGAILFAGIVGVTQLHSSNTRSASSVKFDATDELPSRQSLRESATSSSRSSNSPHIVFVLMDDMGYADIGYNTYDIPHATPRTTELAETGLIMTHYYTENECTPARAAILTGRYPLATGMQHECVTPTAEWGLPVEEKLVANYLQNMGYHTHLVGKWDLGHYANELWPTRRGFDTFYGLTCYGYLDYFTHNNKGFWDLHEWNPKGGIKRRVEEASGDYSTFLFGERARQIIGDHTTDAPLFLYVPFNAVHNTVSVPDGWMDTATAKEVIGGVTDNVRKKFAGALYFADAEVGKIVDTLKANDMYANSVLIFTSDNGGSPTDGGNNFPLRGAKKTFFEGGHRVPAFIHSPLLSADVVGQKWDGLMHAVDWLPTIVNGVAGGALEKAKMEQLDGYNMWHTLNTLGDSPRTEIVLNIDYVNCATEQVYDDIEKVWMGLIVTSEFDGHRYKLMFSQVDYDYYAPFTEADTHTQQNGGRPTIWLFDLTEDAYETTNLLATDVGVADLPKLKAIIGVMAARLCEYYNEKMISSVYNDVGAEGIDYAKHLITQNDNWIYPWRADSVVVGTPYMAKSEAPTCHRSEVETRLWGERRSNTVDTVAAVSTAKKASAALHPQANGEDQDVWEVDKAMGPAGPIGPVEKIEPGDLE